MVRRNNRDELYAMYQSMRLVELLSGGKKGRVCWLFWKHLVGRMSNLSTVRSMNLRWSHLV
jgi:hypothetical protein